MNKAGFIDELDKRLKYIPAEDREDAIEYYKELLSDMEFADDEDVTARLGSPKDAAKKILDECKDKHVAEYEEKKTVKGHATVVWLSILGVLSLPLSLPLAIVVLALAITLVVVFISVIIALTATAVSLVLGGLACFVFMCMAPGIAQKAVIFGMGLATFAIGVLACFGLFYMIRTIFRKIFRRKNKEAKENE